MNRYKRARIIGQELLPQLPLKIKYGTAIYHLAISPGRVAYESNSGVAFSIENSPVEESLRKAIEWLEANCATIRKS